MSNYAVRAGGMGIEPDSPPNPPAMLICRAVNGIRGLEEPIVEVTSPSALLQPLADLRVREALDIKSSTTESQV